MNGNAKKFFKIFLVVVVAGVLDFLTETLFQEVLHAPFFFDMIFAMAVLFVYGPVASMFVYVVNVTIVCIKMKITYGSMDFVYLYSLSAFAIILITWLFVRKKDNLKKSVNFTFLYILTASVCAALCCCIVSGLINFFAYNMNARSLDVEKIIFAFTGEQLGVLASSILGRIPITVLDRIITTFAGFGLSILYTKLLYRWGGVHQ
ncbi:MAG: hypothetical protein II716_09055 [Treponema sp.]|nr:hypothetical protein [Treponema sp.]MBQ5384786.1 hypothetical protein [Treponema sp.]MBQ5472838.1 hypothetical protein [Treponema sp.]